MAKYRKKPVVIEAVQLRWDNWNEMCDFVGVGKLTVGKPQGCNIGEDGKPLADKDGRVEILYKLDSAAKIYRAAVSNLMPTGNFFGIYLNEVIAYPIRQVAQVIAWGQVVGMFASLVGGVAGNQKYIIAK